MASQPWRYRCPEGHASIVSRQSDGYRCESCRRRYAGDPVDMMSDRDRDPDDIESEPEPQLGPRKATSLLWRATGDTDAWAHARDLPVSTKAAASALSNAETYGFVDRYERSRAAQWYVTETGARMVSGDGDG